MSSTKGVGALGIETACPTALLLGPHCEGSSLTHLDLTATSDKSYYVYGRWLHIGCRLILAEYKPGPVARVLQLLRGCAWLSGPGPLSLLPSPHTGFLCLDSRTCSSCAWTLLTMWDPALPREALPTAPLLFHVLTAPAALPPRSSPEAVIPQPCVRLASTSTELRQGRTCILLSKVALLFITGQESSERGLEPGSPRALASPSQQLSVLNFHDSRICPFSPLVTSSQAQPQILPS